MLIRLVVILCIVAFGCESGDISNETPSCIRVRIQSMKNAEARNPPASVWQYSYEGRTVYYIPSYCCDIFSDLYDSSCNLICHPDGGLTGHGDGKCADFFESRANEKLIWKDDRTD